MIRWISKEVFKNMIDGVNGFWKKDKGVLGQYEISILVHILTEKDLRVLLEKALTLFYTDAKQYQRMLAELLEDARKL